MTWCRPSGNYLVGFTSIPLNTFEYDEQGNMLAFEVRSVARRTRNRKTPPRSSSRSSRIRALMHDESGFVFSE
jgi:hypothetical protein